MRSLAALTGLILLLACGGIGPAHEVKINGDLSLYAGDDRQAVTLTGREGGVKIGGVIVAAAWNRDCLVLAQEPFSTQNQPFETQNYYLVSLNSGEISSPLTLSAFTQQRAVKPECTTMQRVVYPVTARHRVDFGSATD